MVTVRDIADRCGVSTATVSKALNGYGDVSPATAEKIRIAAEELHYMPNVAARQLKTNFSHSLGVLFEDETNVGLTHEFFSEILNAAKNEAERQGYDLLFLSRNIGGKRATYLEHARYRRLDGVLIANVDYDSEMVKELVASEIPTITIDYTFNDHSSILSDNIEGLYELTKYIISQGHRKIAFIHGEITSVTKKRLIGFYRALTESKVRIPDRYVVEARYHDPQSTREATRALMNYPDPPTCIIFPDDYSYLGGKAELSEMGLSVPGDVSTCGYDGTQMCRVLYPPLATYEQNTTEMGARAVKKLIESVENPKTCRPEEIQIKGSILMGHSVSRIRS